MERKERSKLLTGREVRQLVIPTNHVEIRSDDKELRFHGVASVTSLRNGKLGEDGSTLSRDNGYDMGWYTERIMTGAFSKTLREKPDVQFLINHSGLPLARTTNNSLTLRETDNGLEYDATADVNDPDAQAVARKIQSGLMDQCSFAFRVMRQNWSEDYDVREITEVDLNRGDVSVVNYGASPTTSVVMRSLLADISELSDVDIADLRADKSVMTSVRQLIELPTFENFATALREIRSGDAFSANGKKALEQFFANYRSDDTVEGVDEFVKEIIGDEPPTDVTKSDEGSEVETLSLDLAKARAHALRLKQ